MRSKWNPVPLSCDGDRWQWVNFGSASIIDDKRRTQDACGSIERRRAATWKARRRREWPDSFSHLSAPITSPARSPPRLTWFPLGLLWLVASARLMATCWHRSQPHSASRTSSLSPFSLTPAVSCQSSIGRHLLFSFSKGWWAKKVFIDISRSSFRRDLRRVIAELPSCTHPHSGEYRRSNVQTLTQILNKTIIAFWELQVQNLYKLGLLCVHFQVGRPMRSKAAAAAVEHRNESIGQRLYGVTVGLSSLVLMFVWIFHFRDGFVWQWDPAIQFNWHPVL